MNFKQSCVAVMSVLTGFSGLVLAAPQLARNVAAGICGVSVALVVLGTVKVWMDLR